MHNENEGYETKKESQEYEIPPRAEEEDEGISEEGRKDFPQHQTD